MKSKLLAALLGLMLGKSAWSQEVSPKKSVYYFDVTEPDAQVHSVYERSLNIEYNDIYGMQKSLVLQVFDKTQQMAGQYQLDKTFGMNHYRLNAESFSEDEVYRGVFTDEGRKEHKFYFKPEPPEEREGPPIDIVSLPVNFSCAEGSPKIIDYYGEISGGVSPFEIDWFIVNQNKTDFLYQPLHILAKELGKTSVITADAAPPYYVVMAVKDFCGGESKKVLLVECDASEKQIHTLFISESFDSLRKHAPSKTSN